MIKPDRLKELEKVYCVFKDNGEITESHITDEYIFVIGMKIYLKPKQMQSGI